MYCRHQLSLYAHISKVTWEFDAKDKVAGAVSDPSGGDIRHFDFNPKETTHYEIVNGIWEMMD